LWCEHAWLGGEELDAVAVEVPNSDGGEAIELAAQARHRQAALDDRDRLVADLLDHRVDHDRQRQRRLVWVPRVVVDLGDKDAVQVADLVGRQPGAALRAHRGDHVVDQALQRGQLRGIDLRGALAQHGVAHLANGERHSRIGIRTPRSSATSIARS